MHIFKTFLIKCEKTFPSKKKILVKPSLYIITEKNDINILEKEGEENFSYERHAETFDRKFYPLKISVVDIISTSCNIRSIKYYIPEKFKGVVEVLVTNINNVEKILLFLYSKKNLSYPYRMIEIGKKSKKEIFSLIKDIIEEEKNGENLKSI